MIDNYFLNLLLYVYVAPAAVAFIAGINEIKNSIQADLIKKKYALAEQKKGRIAYTYVDTTVGKILGHLFVLPLIPFVNSYIAVAYLIDLIFDDLATWIRKILDYKIIKIPPNPTNKENV